VHPHVTGLPRSLPSLDTDRLTLVAFTPDEAERVVAGDRAGRRWSPGYPRDDDRDVARMYLAAPADEPWFGPLQIVRRDTAEVIGGIGFFGPPTATGTLTIGYGVAPEAEGHGFTTEAVRALIVHARRTGRVRRIVADTAPDNVASQRVLEKAGFRCTGSDDDARRYAIDVTPLV
jgi:RimJ/RimL family protein N-acetyltransferase